MCGIVGFIDKSKNKNKVIHDMADLIIHRGPDSSGYYVDNNIALGFRRLSFLDVEGGDQPIYNENKDKVIIFNGEIYNYQDIKNDLVRLGHKFKTKCDTEVILHGYEEYGEGILNKLRGMFAFVIYDIKSKELFGARDFFGIKPFYYYINDGSFMFSSEIKAFLGNPNFKKEFNEEMLPLYLSFQYSVLDKSFFKNVYKLLPGHYFKYKDGKLDIVKYYEIELSDSIDDSFSCVKSKIRELLDDTIEAHKISDVEVGSFLSSGVDSSLIAAMSSVDKTFTVGFDNNNYNEIDYAKDLSSKIGVKNVSKLITRDEYFEEFPKIQYYMDEPLADASAVALYFVAKLASSFVKACLSGEGADEIFGGYNIYQEPYSVSWYYKIPYGIRKCLGVLAYPFRNHRGFNFIIRRGKKLEDRYIGNAFIFDTSEVNKVLKKKSNITYRDVTRRYYDKCKNYDEVMKMQYIDFNFWLVGDILLKADKMSMANSLEVRVPYLDSVLIDYARNLPTKYKVNEKTTKYAFREVAKDVLEDKVASKKKLGFPVPIRVWLKEDDIYNKVKDKFKHDDRFFNTDYLIKLLDEHRDGVHDNSRKIWTVYTFLVWYDEYFGKRV